MTTLGKPKAAPNASATITALATFVSAKANAVETRPISRIGGQ